MTGPWPFRILFDGECPLCNREVHWLRKMDRHRRLAFEDISRPEFAPAEYGVTRDEVSRAIHGVFPDGRVVRGVEVFRWAYTGIGLGWLVAPTRWPGLRWLADRLYAVFARNRLLIGRILGRKCDLAACKPNQS